MFDVTSLRNSASVPAASTDKLLAQANTADDNGKIDKSAKDFESILLGNWLKQAEESFAKVPGTDDEESGDDSGGSQYMDLAMQSLGNSLASNGGIGIGKMIARQLYKTEEKSTETAMPAKS
jgi:Rod binding domain-containing protein